MKIKSKCIMKRELIFEGCKNCLEAAQFENKIDVDSLKEQKKEFIKNNKLILKTQQRFRSEKHKAKEIDKIAVS